MKKIIIGLLLMVPILSFSQQIETSQVEEQWQEIYSLNDVKVSAKKVLCDYNGGFDEYTILLKIDNQSNNEVDFSFKLNKYFNGVCSNCNFSSEDSYLHTIAASSFVEGVCDRAMVNGLKIWESFEGYEAKKTLSGFELVNLNVVQK